MSQLMPLPLTVCCFSKIQIGFTFLVPAHPGSPGQRAVKRLLLLLLLLLCVCVCVTCRLTAKNRDQLRNPTLGSRLWATFTVDGRVVYCDVNAGPLLGGRLPGVPGGIVGRALSTRPRPAARRPARRHRPRYCTIRYDRIRDAILTCARKPT